MSYKISYTIAPPHSPEAISHAAALQRLRLLGWRPSTVYDIGAFQGQWSKDASRIFPMAEFLLFDANPDNEAQLARSGYRHIIAAISARDEEERTLFTTKIANCGTGASLYRENTVFHANENLDIRKAVTARLDTLVAKRKLNHAQLIKIDVQGAELDVLAGAEDALKHCDVLIVEMSLLNYNKGAPLFSDVVAAVSQLGLKCVDICEIHRLGLGLIFQIDLLFVRDSLYRKYYSAAGLL